MSVQLSKGKQILFYIAIFLTNIIVMHDYVILPIVNTLYELFPDSTAGVNFIVSGPALFALVSSLAVPYILNHISKKKLLGITCIVFTVSSISEAAVVALPYMIFTRSVCGFCYGVVQVAAIDIMADYFTDENRRASFMGIYNASMAAVGALMGLIAGNLAVTGWKNVYHTYWLAVPMTLLVLFCVPNLQKPLDPSADEASAVPSAGRKVPMGSKFWMMLLTFVLFSICYTPMFMMPAVYIAENGLGNEALAGLAASVGTIGSCLCCLGFGFLFRKFKARTSLISYVVLAAGLLGMYIFPDKNIFIVICTVSGGAYGMLFSYVFANGPSIVAPENISKAISFLTAGNGFAMFAGTYIVTGLMGAVPTHGIRAVTLILGIVVGVCFVIEFVNTGRMEKE